MFTKIDSPALQQLNGISGTLVKIDYCNGNRLFRCERSGTNIYLREYDYPIGLRLSSSSKSRVELILSTDSKKNVVAELYKGSAWSLSIDGEQIYSLEEAIAFEHEITPKMKIWGLWGFVISIVTITLYRVARLRKWI